MYMALLVKFDLAAKERQGSLMATALLIGANVFLLLTVAVQAALFVKAVYVSHILEEHAQVRG